MVFAMLYGETGDVVGTYESRATALRDLWTFVQGHPELQDEIGLRPYADGRPVGQFESASDVFGEDALTQPHLAAFRTR